MNPTNKSTTITKKKNLNKSARQSTTYPKFNKLSPKLKLSETKTKAYVKISNHEGKKMVVQPSSKGLHIFLGNYNVKFGKQFAAVSKEVAKKKHWGFTRCHGLLPQDSLKCQVEFDRIVKLYFN